MSKVKAGEQAASYAEYKRSHTWIENSLAHSDEDEAVSFDRKLITMFFPYLKQFKDLSILSLVLMVVYTLLNIANPLVIGLAIDDYITRGNMSGLAVISGIFLLMNIAMWLAQYWQVWTMSYAGQHALYLLSADMFKHLQRLSLSFYDHTQIGRVMSRLQSDIDVLESMLSSGLLSILGSVIALVGIIIFMLVMSPTLALLTFVVIPIMIVIAAFWQKHAQLSFRRTRASISLVNSTLQENISGMRVIQSLVREDRNWSEFEALNAYNRDTNLESSKIAALILPLVEVVAAMAICLAVLYGGYLVAQGHLLVGTLVAFVLYINRFFDPIRDLSQQYTQLQRSGVAAERIYQILHMKIDIQDKSNALELPEIDGNVEFWDVVFGYNPKRPVLKKLNWSVKAGQSVAIVGPTGAGKSTIISLLTRFYDIQSGSITIDGYDLRDVTQKSLRQQVGVVPQEPFLFTGSIADNIRYGRLTASDEEVMAAAQTVGAHDLIIQLPDGYNTIIRERGRNLSMGQRQLISFARAMLADPHILILDEATANIDTFTEAIVQQGLKRLLHRRTAFVIAHRLSTIKDSDCIVVLQDGQIVEQGTHNELLQREGEYASLYAMGFRHASSVAV
ncbi:ABC transporter ATP-binding protein [Dictyobacter arantiisoli]|uniref:Multidrug ABC transporter n=1 Tax=Dictyobacter arantiisoli TaxID=2014874 RepID=A0A5A5TL72_9CHLR|nr:ABC transporter ATP-binding protein [Dictyobacter arantiisoli]GCF11876.1 multidrug ABC transporter [Dictyobacter arantiisoli]